MQWYAHQGTAVWCTTGGVDGTIGLGYHDKGWPSFEYRLAMMIKVANTFTFADWPQVVDLSNMAVVLPLCAKLTTLALAGNRIGDKGVAAIAGALKVNGALMTLNLLENEIGPAGASALVDTLRVNGMLAKLYLGGNKLNDNSKKQVQEVVQGRVGFSLYL